MATLVKSETAGFDPNIDWLRAKIAQLEEKDVEHEKKISALEEKVLVLKKAVTELEDENTSLKLKNSGLELKINDIDNRQEAGTSNLFDCYLTEKWVTNGSITFNGCSGKQLHAQI